MARFRFDHKAGKVVEVRAVERKPRHRDSGALWSDSHYDGLRATDGADISSRAKHREYMKINNLTTADDYSESWKSAAKERERYFTRGGSIRKQDIAEAIQQLERSQK